MSHSCSHRGRPAASSGCPAGAAGSAKSQPTRQNTPRAGSRLTGPWELDPTSYSL